MIKIKEEKTCDLIQDLGWGITKVQEIDSMGHLLASGLMSKISPFVIAL